MKQQLKLVNKNLRTLNLLTQLFRSEARNLCKIKVIDGKATCSGYYSKDKYLCCMACQFYKTKNGCKTKCLACSMFYCHQPTTKNTAFNLLQKVLYDSGCLEPFRFRYYLSNKILAKLFTEKSIDLTDKIINTLSENIELMKSNLKPQAERIINLLK